MNPMLELTLADGKELDIPTASVVMFEEMNEGTNPNFPNARSFVLYGLGEGLRNGILSTKFEDLMFELNVSTLPGWLRLTRKHDGMRIVLLAHNVVGRLGLEDGCEISYMLGKDVHSVVVNESRREIKKWSERAMAPPPGMVPVPVPAGE